MEGFKQCANGHFFKNNLNDCPYCPKQNAGSQSNGAFEKTQISNYANDNSSNNSKTQISGNEEFSSTQVFGTGSSKSGGRDLSKTFIQDNEVTIDGVISSNNSRQTRKICGWIVSYTLEAMGIDFRIYEGRNTIGRDPENTITIVDDVAVSGKHITILCKKEKFIYRMKWQLMEHTLIM